MNKPEQPLDKEAGAITTNDLYQGAVLSDSRFNRFDDELIDKYFNEEGKKAIAKYITQSQNALLDRVEKEVIGRNSKISSRDIHRYGKELLNEMKTRQRQALQKIKEEI